MGSFAAGSVVTVRFPLSDLSQAKYRPAIVLANAGRGDWLLCQVTSNAYSDARSVQIEASDFVRGSLHVTSYARPAKLFAANDSIIAADIGALSPTAMTRLRDAVIDLVQRGV